MITTIARTLSTLTLVALVTACGTPAPTLAPTIAPVPTLAPTTVPAPTLVPTAVPAVKVDIAAIDAYMAKMLDTYEVPGAAIALVLPDGSTYTRGYGVRDLATKTPVTADTQFAIASVTKSFTSLGMLLLVDEGKVDLDAPVTTYLPEFQLADPAMTPKVTVRHLLTHTTGMERNDAATFRPGITRDEIVALAAETPLVAAPGEVFVYSNVNTIAAARIIELVSGQSWEAFTRERVLEPLGLDHVTLDTAALQQQPDYALPHDRDLLAGMMPTQLFEPGAEAPAGGINASANEMLRYLQFQLGDGSMGGAPLLSAAALVEMHRPAIALSDQFAQIAAAQGVPAPERLTSDDQYGMYWFNERLGGHRIVKHDGQVLGFSASMSFAPEANVGVVLLTNANYALGFVETVRLRILEELLAVEPRHDTYAVVEKQMTVLGMDQVSMKQPSEAVHAFTPDSTQLVALAGSYTTLANNRPLTVSVVDERGLLLEGGSILGYDLPQIELLPIAPDTFLVNTAPFRGLTMQFNADADEVTILQQGQPFARRIVQP